MIAGSVMSAAVVGAPAWDIVVGDRFIAAVAAPAPDACTAALAEAASNERVTIEALVGRIPVGATGPVESFAVVWWQSADPTEVTAVVRGDAVVDLTSPGGTRRFDARDIHPWHLAEFGDVVALRITSADAPLDRLGEASDPVRHARASLRASSIEWTSAPATVPLTIAVVDADTILVPRRRLPPAVRGSRPSDAGPANDELGDADTILATPGSPSPRSTTDAVLAPDDVAPVPDSTASAVPLSAPSERGVPAPAFRIGGGSPHPVTVPVLIGRRPLAPRIPGAAGAAPELVTVPSPRSVVSGTHLELRMEGARLVATDLRSTNGTVVRSPSGSRRMRAGESIVVAPGTSLDLGDDTIVEIILAPSAPAERSQTDSRPHP